MKKIDVLMFNDETDILHARLKYLYEEMDYFVITEFDQTFSGFKKDFNFEKNFLKFKKFSKKIIYQKAEFEAIKDRLHSKQNFYTDFSKCYEHKHKGKIPKNLHRSVINEILQRDASVDGLLKVAKEDDIIFLSDVDEFPSLKFVEKISNLPDNKTLILEQDWRQFYLNYRVIVPWYGTVVSSLSNIRKNSIDLLRCGTSVQQDVPHQIVQNGGWHLSYLGGAHVVRKKLNDLAYQGIRSEITRIISNISSKYLENRLKNGKDILNQNKRYEVISLKNFPIEIFEKDFIEKNVF